jgi:4-amino-4-deoxy-L-arabinose transferase-like glycosyltransferase
VTDRALVVAILGIGLVARVGIALASGNSFQFPDEAVYADTAHRLIAGQGFGPAYARVPAYPVFLASLAGPGWASVLVLRVVQAVLTGFGTVLLYAFTAQAIGRGPALAAALFYAVDPVLVAAAGLLYPEALAAVLMIAVALAALLGVRGDRLDRTALAGLLLGVLIQLRPVALGLIPVLAAWMSVSIPARWSRRLLHSGGLLLVCLLSLLPWTYRNYRVHGQLMPVATAGTRAAPVWNSEVAQRGLTVSILGNAWTEPGKFARRIGGEFLHFWEIYPTRLATDNPRLRSNMRVREPRMSAAPIYGKGVRDTLSAISFTGEMILAVLGVALAWRSRRRETVLLCMLILTFALGYTMFVAKLRYRIPILPLLFVFAGTGAYAAWEAARACVRRRTPRPVSVWQD